MLQSELVRILLVFFFAFGSVATIFIIVRSIKNYRLADSKKSSVIIRLTIVFLIWAAVSTTFFLLLALSSIGDRFGAEPEIKSLADAADFLIAFLIWLLAGGALTYWISRPPKIDGIRSV